MRRRCTASATWKTSAGCASTCPPATATRPTPYSTSTAESTPTIRRFRSPTTESEAMRRVIQFSTGNVGRHSLRAIIGRPDLELVGVHASGPDKIGKDAAELSGLETPTGITATGDVDELVGLGADCVVYTSQGET